MMNINPEDMIFVLLFQEKQDIIHSEGKQTLILILRVTHL